jgi:hypothetical protein
MSSREGRVVTLPSPSPRRVHTPSWFDLRLLVGIALVLGSVLVGATVVSGAHHTYRMVAVTHDVAAGARLQDGDLTTVEVRLPDHGDGVYVRTPHDAVGHELNRALSRGELVPVAALGTAPATTRLSVPLDAGRAPALHSGQRVELWLSTKTCASVVLLRDVTVQGVHADSSGIGAGPGQDVVVDVSSALADRVVAALALQDSVIRAGVLSGPRRDGVNDDLPGLDACSAPSS